MYVRSPTKSTVRASRELGVPQHTVRKTLRKRLVMKPYMLQMVQEITDDDKESRFRIKSPISVTLLIP
jgi:hypothetical protein